MSGRGSTVSERYLPTTNEKPSETMFQRILLDFVLKTFGLGAENETRTRDPNLGKVVLYQLSYFRVFAVFLFRLCSPCQGWNFYSFWGKVVLCQLSYFRNFLKRATELNPFCECKYRWFFLFGKENVQKNPKYFCRLCNLLNVSAEWGIEYHIMFLSQNSR